MLNKFFDFILYAYKEESLEIRKKTRLFLIVNSIVFALFILNILISEIMISRNYLFAVVEGIMAVLVLGALFLVKKKKFLAASNITLVQLSIAMFLLSLFTRNVTVSFILIQIALLQIPVIIYPSLIGIRPYQSILISILAIGFLSSYFLTLPLTVADFTFKPEEIYNYIVSLLMIFISGVMSFLTLKNNGQIISLVEAESGINREKNRKIEGIVRSSREGVSVGEKLKEFTERTLELLGGIDKRLEQIKKETVFLNTIIKSSQDSNTVMLASSGKVKTIISEQNAAVNETSSSVEEITRSMNNIAATTSAKKETIDRLVQTARESEMEMSQSVQSIREMSRSAEDMLGIIKVIQDVASQTNVLAMNAAIEASHAGASGRGFAIVAAEIRKLSVETDRNSKIISAGIKKSISDIERATTVNVKVGEYFQKMSAEVVDVKKAMDEIIIGVQEVSKGTGSILEAVTEILNMSGEVDRSMSEVDIRVSESNGNIQNIAKFTLELKDKIDTTVKNFEDIIHFTRLIDQTGKENTANIEKLDREISQIMQ